LRIIIAHLTRYLRCGAEPSLLVVQALFGWVSVSAEIIRALELGNFLRRPSLLKKSVEGP